MKKNFLIAAAIILLIGVFVGIFFLLSKNKTFPLTFPNLSQSPQKLKVVESGVTLTRDNQNTDLTKDSETSLNVGDKVVTNNTGTAVILYGEGTNVKLSSNTRVTFDGGTNLIEDLGKVYVRFKKVLGGSEDFSVETPTMVATVRGTAFASIIKKDLDPKIIVTEHEVEVTQKDEATGKRLTNKQLVKMGEQLEFIRSRKQFRLAKQILTSEEREWIEENKDATPSPSITPSPVSKISATIKPTTIATISATPSYSSFTQMPGAGYHQGNVITAVGNFIISCIGSAKGSTHVVTDSGNDSDCTNNCTVLPLDQYATRNGGFAAMNGMYFCPADYASCAGKTNSFDTLFFNSRVKTYINSANNVYSTIPFLVINADGTPRFIGQSSAWGRDTGIQAGTAGNPMLIQGTNIAVVDGNLDDKQRTVKSNRGAFVESGNTIYLCIIGGATIPDSAQVYKALKVDNAINIDGGGSSALWLNGRYIYGPGRSIPTAIIFK